MQTIDNNLLHPQVVLDPYSYYEVVRQNDPIYWNAQWDGWIFTSYEDVRNGFQDLRLSSERVRPSKGMGSEKKQEMSSTYAILSNWLVFNDPPKHTRLRMLMMKAFTPKAITKLLPNIEETANYLINEIRTKPEGNILQSYASILPIMVISDLLGVPKEDRNLIKKWSDDLMLLVFGAADVENRHEVAKQSMDEMVDYLKKIIQDRRVNPKDDLISALVQASEDQDQLTDDEVISTCTLLVFGGHETTTNLIANGLLAFHNNRDQLELLKEKPELINTAVDEILRYDGPSKAMVRVAKEDVVIRDKHIKTGDKILLVQASANRDPNAFERPNQFDITRNPNHHLGFGRGIHYCLGAPLAVQEGRIALAKFIEAFPNYQVLDEKVEWQPTFVNRGLKHLNVKLY
ncbi:cytochrome P450 [Alkalihalobacterium alkalinitrilicum]|uniref:cytochrome P450 n=1 Tax=Alkalihalobacterium alkalinitrilicum TaxID=427920 RepID=UPI00099582CE|nr:cytochrome P450 [Alkalihalobacterium alkalinitrilicum]